MIITQGTQTVITGNHSNRSQEVHDDNHELKEKSAEDKRIEKEMMDMLNELTKQGYTDKVFDYGVNPRNYGVMEKPDAYASITGPCGDTVEIYLRMKKGKIEDKQPQCALCPYEWQERFCRKGQGKAPDHCPSLRHRDLAGKAMEVVQFIRYF